MEIDWDALGDAAGDEFSGLLKEWVAGAEEDVRAYGRAMMKDSLRLLRSGSPALREELRAQALLLAEKNRIRAADAVMDMVVRWAETLGRVALGALRLRVA